MLTSPKARVFYVASPIALFVTSLSISLGLAPAPPFIKSFSNSAPLELAQQRPGAEVQSCELAGTSQNAALEGTVSNRSDQPLANVTVRYQIIVDRGSEARGGRVDRRVFDRSSRRVQGNSLAPFQNGPFRTNSKNFGVEEGLQGEILEVVWVNRDGSRGIRRYDPPMRCFF